MGDGTPGADRPRRARADHPARRRAADRRADIGEELTPDEVLALGQRSGDPAPLPPAGAARGADPVVAGAAPRVPATGSPGRRGRRPARGAAAIAAASRRALLRWMEEKELLLRPAPASRAGSPGSRSAGFQAALRRSTAAFGGGSAAVMLAKADTVSATLLALEAGILPRGARRPTTRNGADRVRRRRRGARRRRRGRRRAAGRAGRHGRRRR